MLLTTFNNNFTIYVDITHSLETHASDYNTFYVNANCPWFTCQIVAGARFFFFFFFSSLFSPLHHNLPRIFTRLEKKAGEEKNAPRRNEERIDGSQCAHIPGYASAVPVIAAHCRRAATPRARAPLLFLFAQRYCFYAFLTIHRKWGWLYAARPLSLSRPPLSPCRLYIFYIHCGYYNFTRSLSVIIYLYGIPLCV